MIHTPEQWQGEVLLRADFRAFYAMELAWNRPLVAVLGEPLESRLSEVYRLAWCMAETWRRETSPRLAFQDFLDLLPAGLLGVQILGIQLLGLCSEALTATTPMAEPDGTPKGPERVAWTRLFFERSLVGIDETTWWRSTFRTHWALIWELARHHDPDGKYGRPMAEWEIEAANQRNLMMLRGFGDGNETHSHWTG